MKLIENSDNTGWKVHELGWNLHEIETKFVLLWSRLTKGVL